MTPRTHAGGIAALALAALAGCAGAPPATPSTAGDDVAAASECVDPAVAQAVLTSTDSAGERRTKARSLANC